MPETPEKQKTQPQQDALCKSCNYPLKNLQESRCPECGLEFDPEDSTTFATPLTKKLSNWPPAIVLTLHNLCLLFITLVVWNGYQSAIAKGDPLLFEIQQLWGILFFFDLPSSILLIPLGSTISGNTPGLHEVVYTSLFFLVLGNLQWYIIVRAIQKLNRYCKRKK